MPRPGQCHVPQAQVFAQAVAIGQLRIVPVKVQHPVALATRLAQLHDRCFACRDFTVAVRKGQAHHRVLEALAGVDGDDLDQVFVAFQAHGFFFALARAAVQRFVNLLDQPTDQRLLAVELAARRLQQLGQVQHIGQTALAVGLVAPAPRQLQPVQRLAQHGQHALGLPGLLQLAHLLGTLVQQVVLRGQRVQLGQRQPHGARAQSRTHAARVAWLGHAPQPQAQVLRLVAGEHRVAVGQIHRSHTAHTQRVAHGIGLHPGAHQHGDVFGLERFVAMVRIGKAGMGVTQPGHDLLSAQGRQVRPCIAHAAQRGVVHQRHGRHRPAAGVQHFGAAVGLDALKRQRVFIGCAVAKGVCRNFKPAVDRIDHRLGGAEIGAQHMVAARGGAARGQVAVDVRPPKTVNRLFGVTDQQQRRVQIVICRAVDKVKDAELQGRGVLELVDERHRKLLTQALRQALARFRVGQRRVQALEHVGKAKQAAAALELGHALQHMAASVQTGLLLRIGQGLQVGLQLGIGLAFGRQRDRVFAGFAAGQQALGGEAFPASFHGALQSMRIDRALRPGFEHAQPVGAFFDTQFLTIPAVIFGGQLGLDPAEQVVGLVHPPQLERRQLRLALGQGTRVDLRQRTRRGLGQGHGHQGPHVGVEGGHVAPDALHLRHLLGWHGVELLAPIVLHGFQAQCGLIADQVFFKQVAAVKSVLAQHALAPSVNGVDGRVVHGLRGQR